MFDERQRRSNIIHHLLSNALVTTLKLSGCSGPRLGQARKRKKKLRHRLQRDLVRFNIDLL
ncbi:hypothetical protein FVEG_06321 [Fusarium verticillioides 7600]|uniref:Uncharacterized protein n=1 Tax=Gibberella moniliformis (strain M3125 / FGSC 7600) TaxID=334819 RepID=W7MDB1_GIBM7|nr:hypothetical protein FVEG_06321 [Fusarium verticillioides 7600]EWG45584.1 hypothetical protein FVEG_06321 [Fusarium verticillioides 7600]